MNEMFEINAGMIAFWQNITLNLIIAFVTVLCWYFIFVKKTRQPKRWKSAIYKIIAIAGTIIVIVKTWFFFGFFLPLITAVALLTLCWFFGACFLYFISWLFDISDEEWDKVIKIFLY